VIVNLAPADLLKEGSHFDLPIALGVLAAMELIPRDAVAEFAALGELGSMDAGLRVRGVAGGDCGRRTGTRPDLPRAAGAGRGLGRPRSRCWRRSTCRR
jgi:hypothetical protein